MPAAPEKPDRYRLPARRRVKRAGLFQEAYRQGNKQVGRHLVLWSRSGEDADTRLGVVASRKVGSSVARSRAKRLLRELFRLHQHELRGNEDVILVARKSLLKASPEELRRDFLLVLSRAGRLQSRAEGPKDTQNDLNPFAEPHE